jgi:hypothetical protein
MKPLSDQLAELSVRAKKTEDSVAAAQKEAHDKLTTRKAQARASVTSAVDKVSQELKSAKDQASTRWAATQAKVTADINAMQARFAESRHERDVKRAEKNADQLEWEASFAIDYAIASVEQAQYAVLDAIDGRLSADEAAQS